MNGAGFPLRRFEARTNVPAHVLRGRVMDWIYGAAMLVAGCAMIWLGRAPAGADTAPFLRAWVVLQAYCMTAMILGVGGVALLIAHMA
ncbi:MAG: hypothetical protein OJF62_003464 [Pseudolabrys sp.]|nr:hypothetical protein [Pseudolabrys sp.]